MTLQERTHFTSLAKQSLASCLLLGKTLPIINLTMKTFILSVIFILCTCGVATAQTFERATTTTTQSITKNITIAGKSFTGGVGKTGAVYITRTSAKSGNTYKQYLGYQTEHTFEGANVYRNKANTEFCIYELSKTGFPKKIVLNTK